jgi:hypothetical protein
LKFHRILNKADIKFDDYANIKGNFYEEYTENNKNITAASSAVMSAVINILDHGEFSPLDMKPGNNPIGWP